VNSLPHKQWGEPTKLCLKDPLTVPITHLIGANTDAATKIIYEVLFTADLSDPKRSSHAFGTLPCAGVPR
jgi:hypothetical protein